MGRSTAMAAHWRIPYAKVAVRSQASNSDFSGGQSSTGTGFPRSTLFFHCQYYSTNVSILTFFYTTLLSEIQAGKAWEPSKKRFSFRNRRVLDTKGVPRRFPSQSSKKLSIPHVSQSSLMLLRKTKDSLAISSFIISTKSHFILVFMSKLRNKCTRRTALSKSFGFAGKIIH